MNTLVASIRARLAATAAIVARALEAEPILVLSAFYLAALGIWEAAQGGLDPNVLLPALGAVVIRLVAQVPRLRDIAGVWSPRSANALAEHTDLDVEAAVLLAEAQLVEETPKPEDDA
jgi:hypothetical protein